MLGLAIGVLVPSALAILSGAPIIGTRFGPLVTASPSGGARPSGPSGAVADIAATPAPATAATPRPTRDTRRPTIQSRSPGAGATNVAAGASVRIRFSEPVKGVSGSTIQLVNVSGGWVVRATVSYDARTRTATLNPSLNMYPATRYRVTVLAGITDAAGNRLAPTTWTFRVAPG